jgi:hypothetical protein
MEKIRIRDPGWKKVGYWMEKIRIRDPGWKKFGSRIRDGKNSELGSVINIKHPGSATLVYRVESCHPAEIGTWSNEMARGQQQARVRIQKQLISVLNSFL